MSKLKKYRFPKFPLAINITNKNVPKSYLRVVRVDENIKNLKEAIPR